MFVKYFRVNFRLELTARDKPYIIIKNNSPFSEGGCYWQIWDAILDFPYLSCRWESGLKFSSR